MTEPGISLADLETYADELREMAPVLRDEAARLPSSLEGSFALSRQYGALMRQFGATHERLASEIETFAEFYRSHLDTCSSTPGLVTPTEAGEER